MDASESVLRAGYRLDRYELLCPIASGGMATVWLARLRGKRGFEKLFAVKTIRTELVDDERFQEMFLDEARIASGIQHPNVAQILDLGEQQDVLFIVMEWVDGDSLAKIRKLVAKGGGKIPTGIALRILADACAGLHAAHELRDDNGHLLEVVHRDVSPQNILVGTAGAVKVIDFGIAKAQNRRQGSTRTGIVKGKIQYMAPEQVKKGRSVDRRADIWALGVTLHELVTGKPPNDGEDDMEVIRRLMSDEPPTMAEGNPEAIASVLARSVTLDPDARFPTAAGMQRALEAAMKELGETATSEDVAAFLRSELPDLAQRRRDLVGRAVDDARERGTPAEGSRDPDVAFAPTIMSERQGLTRKPRHSDAAALALTRRKDSPAPKAPPLPGASSDDSRLASSVALDHEPIEIPKRSRAWLWALLGLVAGGAAAAVTFPGATNLVLTAMGWGSPGTDAVQPPSTAAMPAPSASEPSRPSSAAPSAPPPAPSSVPSASAPASSHRPETLHHTWPREPSTGPSSRVPGPPPKGAAVSSAGSAPWPVGGGPFPSASGIAPAPPAPSAVAPWPSDTGVALPPPPVTAAPAASEDDPNKPYN